MQLLRAGCLNRSTSLSPRRQGTFLPSHHRQSQPSDCQTCYTVDANAHQWGHRLNTVTGRANTVMKLQQTAIKES